jgi:hypothetical protein
MPIPIVEIERSDGGYYIIWHNAAARAVFDIELFDFRITDIIKSKELEKSLELIDSGADSDKIEIDIEDKSFVIYISKTNDSVLQLVFSDITNIKKKRVNI